MHHYNLYSLYKIIILYEKFKSSIKLSDIKYNFNYVNNKKCILLCGQIRNNFYQTLLSHKMYILDPLHTDVFCVFSNADDKMKNIIINLLKPTKILWINDNDITKSYFNVNIMGQFYKWYKCNQLKIEYEKQNNFTYDVCIKSRPDVYIKSYLPEKIINNINPNTFYYATPIKYFNISDQVFLSNSITMNIVTNMYIYYLNNPQKICDIPEAMLYEYLNKNNIKVLYIDNFIHVIHDLISEKMWIHQWIYKIIVRSKLSQWNSYCNSYYLKAYYNILNDLYK